MKEDRNFWIAMVECVYKSHPREIIEELGQGYLHLQPAGQRASGTVGPPHSHWPRCWSNGCVGAAEGEDLIEGRVRGGRVALASTALGCHPEWTEQLSDQMRGSQ